MKKLWVWHWKGFGYNSTTAYIKEEAIIIAKAMAKNTCLELDEESVHEGTYEELAQLDRKYGTLFD